MVGVGGGKVTCQAPSQAPFQEPFLGTEASTLLKDHNCHTVSLKRWQLHVPWPSPFPVPFRVNLTLRPGPTRLKGGLHLRFQADLVAPAVLEAAAADVVASAAGVAVLGGRVAEGRKRSRLGDRTERLKAGNAGTAVAGRNRMDTWRPAGRSIQRNQVEGIHRAAEGGKSCKLSDDTDESLIQTPT